MSQKNKDLEAAQKRLQEKQRKEMVLFITNMNRHQRRAFAKVNGLPKIKGTRTDHIK